LASWLEEAGEPVGVTLIERTIAVGHDIRTELLHHDEAPRNLAGQCGLAAMLVATALGKPQVLRTGFYMKRETFCGKRGRYPHRHAWCRVGPMIVDVTATQFDRRNKAVHVALFDEDLRYIETARGARAVDDIMTRWCGRELPVYVQLAKGLRRRLR
jgi:hypothetical protein